jgi:hypothetical protein
VSLVAVDEVEPVAAGVAPQLLEADDEVERLDATVSLLSVLTALVVELSFDVVADAPESADWTAIAPPRPTSVATLAVATALRARPAGCGRFRRGVASGISRSFGGWRSVQRISELIVRDGGKRS